MPRIRRRQAVDEEDGSPPPPTQRHQRGEATPDETDDVEMEDGQGDNGSGSLAQLSKGLVRYALSCEFSRKPIKRQDINERVLGSHSRLFKDVFTQANIELMEVFGMQMVELPKAERVTARQKRAAAASASQSQSSAMWILQTILPEQYRIPEIIGPSRRLPEDEVNREDSYVGLYTMVIAMITIVGGVLSEERLDRQLRRLNADRNTPLGTTDKTLALMIKDGYIVRIRDNQNGTESVDYIVGPRGKMEVGREGFRNFVAMMHGEDEDGEELEKRIERTLNIADAFNGSGTAVEAEPGAGQAAGRKRGRARRDEGDGDDE